MPKVVFYREIGGVIPVLEWLDRLPDKARLECIVRIRLLEARGYLLQRPHCGYLRAGIFELRAKSRGVNYRILYCFHQQGLIVLVHGFVKQRAKVPPIEIERALERESRFATDPARHTHVEG